jgi:hypothetical protein
LRKCPRRKPADFDRDGQQRFSAYGRLEFAQPQRIAGELATVMSLRVGTHELFYQAAMRNAVHQTVRKLLRMHDEQFSFARHPATKLRQVAAAVQAQFHNFTI